jgi:hypothetical protein
MVREPEESLFSGKRILGKALTRSEALASPLAQEFFDVADHIAHNDPAVQSYLSGEHVSSKGREATHLAQRGHQDLVSVQTPVKPVADR